MRGRRRTAGRRGIGSDSEPSLGALGSVDQTRGAFGNREEVEEQCDDEGAVDVNREPDHEDGCDGGVDKVSASRGTSPLWEGAYDRRGGSSVRFPEIDPRSPVWHRWAPVT